MFQIRIRVEGKFAFLFLWVNLGSWKLGSGNLSVKRGLLCYCALIFPEIKVPGKRAIDQPSGQPRKVPLKEHVFIIFDLQAIVLREPNL